ncbi:hypothetical protein ACS0PU_001439 [Formica fusca]
MHRSASRCRRQLAFELVPISIQMELNGDFSIQPESKAIYIDARDTRSEKQRIRRRFNVAKTIQGIPTRIHHGAQGRHSPAPRKPSTLSSSTCTRLLIGLVEAAFTPVYLRDHLRARRREPVCLLVTNVSSSNRNVPSGYLAGLSNGS